MLHSNLRSFFNLLLIVLMCYKEFCFQLVMICNSVLSEIILFTHTPSKKQNKKTSHIKKLFFLKSNKHIYPLNDLF